MICAHCNESFSAWRGLSSIIRAGYKCPACGKFSYLEFVERRDRSEAFLVLGFAAAFVVLLFVAAQSKSMAFVESVPRLALIGFIAVVAITTYRARHRYRAVASLPQHELRRRRRFAIGTVLYLASILLYFLTRWLEWSEGIGFVVFMTGAIAFIVISFGTRKTTIHHDTP